MDTRIAEARMILDMLVHRLRENGPNMNRSYLRARVQLAAEKLNEIAPRSILRADSK